MRWHEKNLLEVSLSNCTLTDGIACLGYRKPFDMSVKGIENDNLLRVHISDCGLWIDKEEEPGWLFL